MLILTSALLVIATIAFVGYPLFRHSRATPGQEAAPPPEKGPDPAVAAELELDLNMGHLSEEDYRQLKADHAPEGTELE